MSEIESLWGEEFEIPQEKEKVKKIVNKINKPKELKVTVEKQIKSKALSLEERLKLITEEVTRVLGKQKENILCIKDIETLHNYITKAIEKGRIDIDTETNNSLDPITCKLMGPCIYTPGEKQAYIPLNHRDPETKERLSWQLNEEDIKREFQRLIDNKILIIMHNGKFDYQVIKCTCDIEIKPDWDTMIAAKLIDENEFTVGLKQLYIKYIDPDQEKYSIEKLFEGVEYADVDPEVFAYYAATDSMMTDKLYEYQLPIMTATDMYKVYKLFKEVEMPCVVVTAEMELQGVYFDKEYSERLKLKYHNKLNKLDLKIEEYLDMIKPKINAWRLTSDATKEQYKKLSEKQYANAVKSSQYDSSLFIQKGTDWYKLSKSKNDQLDEEITPDSLASPVQLGILLYDILKCPTVNNEKPYATGEEELQKLKDKEPLCALMLERRELSKLINAFIDSLAEQVNPKDGRIHGHFNQYGAATGRFSSSEPNLQQIPSHNKEIRMLFRAKPGYVLVGSDFSQQEPRLLSQFSQDTNMINAYKQGKDLYATIATGVYHNKYEDNLECYPDGTLNAEGKKRRGNCKSLLLGIMYGRGSASIAEQIHGTVEEAQKIVNDFYKSFPQVKAWMDESEESCRKNGYVEDLWGRRRRLPDMLLPRFTVRYKDSTKSSNYQFNPLIGCSNRVGEDKTLEQYKSKCELCKSRKQIDELKLKALNDGVEIINNGGFISSAQRQCVNARIQGSAATMTKKAMIKIYNDKELRDLGFRLEIGVHDELIGECPVENINRVAELLTTDMKTCAEDVVSVPFKCDADYSYNWYWNDYKSVVLQEFLDYAKNHNNNYKEAFNYITENHIELTRENLFDVVEGYDVE